MNSKDVLSQKQQETAEAVTQMRNRLKAMGILEKTVNPPTNIESTPGLNNLPEFLPPPPPPAPNQLKEENDNDTASTVSGGSDLEPLKDHPEEDIDESSYRDLLRC